VAKLADTLYATYIKDRRGLEILENEFGFLTYKFAGEECFIAEMCIDPRKRTAGHGRSLVSQLEEMAKAAGCKYVSANIDINSGGANTILLASLLCGYEVRASNGNALLVIKELGA
jgi:GNAT superfamily N-acetyltransferase